MLDHRGELRHRALEVALVEIFGGAELEEPIIGVDRHLAAIIEVVALIVVLQREQPVGQIGKTDRAVAVEIVVHPPVVPRRLRAHCLERGVRPGERHRGGIAGIGDAPHPHLAAVAGDVLDQPVDRVPAVGRFVGALPALGVERHRHGEVAVRLELAAHVLEDEDVAVLHQETHRCGDRKRRRAGNAIGRALEEDRELARLARRAEDHRLELRAVAHRHHHLLIGEGQLRLGGRCLLRRRRTERNGERRQSSQTQIPHIVSPFLRVSIPRRAAARRSPWAAARARSSRAAREAPSRAGASL